MLQRPTRNFARLTALLAFGLGSLGAAVAATPSHAAEPTPHKAPAGKASEATSAAKPADGASSPKLSLPASKAEPAGPQDPLDQLRDRLAAKLGATKAPGARSERQLQVASPATGEFHLAAGSHAKPRPAAARAPRSTATDPAHRSGKDAAHGASGHAPHWSYEGEAGPLAWGQLRAEYSTCSTGTRQSPIDIRDGFAVELEPPLFDYRPTGFSVVDNGHTVQVNVGPGNALELMGRRFDLVQFHFHRPSEERINGRAFDMVAHLVHKDAQGRLAVVAVLLDRGSAQPLVQTIWNNLPLEKGEPLAARVSLDLNQLLPEDRRYYTYMGSLTTPPCSEGVLWVVMQQPVSVSLEQIDIFSRLYPMNARPIQASTGRMIKQSR